MLRYRSGVSHGTPFLNTFGYAGSSLMPHSIAVSRMPAPLLAAVSVNGKSFRVMRQLVR